MHVPLSHCQLLIVSDHGRAIEQHQNNCRLAAAGQFLKFLERVRRVKMKFITLQNIDSKFHVILTHFILIESFHQSSPLVKD